MTLSEKLFRWLGILTLFVWGTLFLYFYQSGRVVHYLAGEFRSAALLGGLFMYVLALYNFLTFRAGREAPSHAHSHAAAGCAHDHDEHCEHEHHHSNAKHESHGAVDAPHLAHTSCNHDSEHDAHDHRHEDPGVTGVLVTFFFLLVPLLTAAAFTRDRASGQAIVNRGLYSATATASGAERFWQDKTPDKQEIGSFTLADLEQLVDRSPDGNYILDLISVFYAAGDSELQRVLAGLPVETMGQVLPERVNNAEGKRLRLFRLFMECCANDMRPIGIPIEFTNTAPQFEDESWVKVIGKLRFPTEDGVTVSVLDVEHIEPTEEPRERIAN